MASVFSPRKRFPGEIRVRSCNRCINMREPRARVEASTRRHENAMKPSPMTVERGGGEWWRRTKVRARGEGSLMGRKGGWQNFLNSPPLVTGYDFANFSGLEKFRLPCERLKHPLFSSRSRISTCGNSGKIVCLIYTRAKPGFSR